MLPAQQKDGTQLPQYLLHNFVTTTGETLNMGDRPDLYIDGPTFEGVSNNYYNQKLDVYEDKMGEWGRELHLGDNYGVHMTWIEGVGSLDGLFFGPMRHTTCGSSSGTALLCLKVKDEIKYLDSECTACFQTRRIGSLESDKMQTEVSVRYKAESQSIEIGSAGGGLPFLFSLLTLDGRVIEQFMIDDVLTTVNASALAKGIYLYKVIGDQVSPSGKFIVN